MMNKLDAAFQFHQSALRIRSARQELIAANIANADTPHYKARDLDFKSMMQQALSTQANAVPANLLQHTAVNHLNALPTANTMLAGPHEPMFRPLTQGSVDGNSVDMDIERNQFVDNGIRYEASLDRVNGQIKRLMTAIQGQ